MAANSFFDDDLSSSQSEPPRYVEIIERIFPDDDDEDTAYYQMTPNFKMSPIVRKKSLSFFRIQLLLICFSKWNVVNIKWKSPISEDS